MTLMCTCYLPFSPVRYNLLSKFSDLVKSFVNTHPIAVEKCGNSMKYLSLRQTAKVLLNPNNNEAAKVESQPEEGAASSSAATSSTSEDANHAATSGNENFEQFEGNAAIRVKLAYGIGQQLARGIDSTDELSPEQLNDKFVNLAHKYAHSIDIEIEELKEQERILERQSSLRPIFLQYFRSTLHYRVKAVTYRRVLAELGYEMEGLQALWNESKKVRQPLSFHFKCL